MADPLGMAMSIIDLLEKAKGAYDKFKDAKNLPKAFGTIAGQIQLATGIFKDVKSSSLQPAQQDRIRAAVEQCEIDAKELNEIFQLVSEHINDKWHDRYKRYVASMKEGRKGEVEKIWRRILDGTHLLASEFGMQKLAEIAEAMKDIDTLPSSLEEANTGVTSIVYGNAGVSGANYGKVTMGDEFTGNKTVNYGKGK